METGSQSAEEGSVINSLQEEVKSLKNTMKTQTELIQKLQARLEGTDAPTMQTHIPSAGRNSIKAPPISMFAGKVEDRNSEKVKSFFYSVQRYGKLCNYSESNMLDLAECYLQDRAASWMMRLENENRKPESLEDLQKAMMDEFVPANEKAAARVKLMDLRMKDSNCLEDHITRFEDLISICGTANNEAYIYFFNSLPKTFKAKFAERFPTSQPMDRFGAPSIQPAYDYARTLELSLQLAGDKEQNYPNKSHGKKKTNAKYENQHSDPGKQNKDNKAAKDLDAVSWGSAKRGEHGQYRQHDRCFKCGEKGWSDPEHGCRKKSAQRSQSSKN